MVGSGIFAAVGFLVAGPAGAVASAPLLVIAIIAVLAALLLPALSRTKALARSAKCRGNLRQLALFMSLYVSDHQVYPAFAGNTPAVMWIDANNPQGVLNNPNNFVLFPRCTENYPAAAGTDSKYFYWYNTLGSIPPNVLGRNDWGLGLARNVNPLVLPFGVAIKEGEVVAPADMLGSSSFVS